eukprot:scaffold172108_cov18-Tisochrysis_lutea.AAC.1
MQMRECHIGRVRGKNTVSLKRRGLSESNVPLHLACMPPWQCRRVDAISFEAARHRNAGMWACA